MYWSPSLYFRRSYSDMQSLGALHTNKPQKFLQYLTSTVPSFNLFPSERRHKFSKIFSGRQPLQVVQVKRRFGDQLRLHHQEYDATQHPAFTNYTPAKCRRSATYSVRSNKQWTVVTAIKQWENLTSWGWRLLTSQSVPQRVLNDGCGIVSSIWTDTACHKF